MPFDWNADWNGRCSSDLPASFFVLNFCFCLFQLNCFACTAIYRFQLIFVRRKRKVPMVEYVPGIRNTIVTSSPVPIVRQTQQYQQQQSLQQQQQHQQHMVKVVSPKIVKAVPVRNTITFQQSPQPAHRVVVAQQQPLKREEDASRLRQMLEKRQLSHKQSLSASPAAKRYAVASQKQQNFAQRIVHAQPTQVVSAPDIGSSEEDIETEVIDSSMVEVEMTSNSNSPLPRTIKQNNNKSKVVVQREPNVSVMEESKSPAPPSNALDPNPLKCDLCHKEFHSLRQRERHRVTHTKDSTSVTGRNKTISLSEERGSSPNNSNKQSPIISTKASGTPPTTNTGKRTGAVLKRAKLSHTPDPMEDAVIEVTTAGEDSEN